MRLADTGGKYIPVSELRRLLSELNDDWVVYCNEVGNLGVTVLPHDQIICAVDFGEEEIEWFKDV